MSNLWTFCLVTLLKDHLSKICMTLFWPMVHRCQKCSDIWTVTSGGWAEIENVKKCRPSDFQFQLSHQMALFKCQCSFCIYGPLVKKESYRFLEGGVLTKLFNKIALSCCFLLFLASSVASILNLPYPVIYVYSKSRISVWWTSILQIFPFLL